MIWLHFHPIQHPSWSAIFIHLNRARPVWETPLFCLWRCITGDTTFLFALDNDEEQNPSPASIYARAHRFAVSESEIRRNLFKLTNLQASVPHKCYCRKRLELYP